MDIPSNFDTYETLANDPDIINGGGKMSKITYFRRVFNLQIIVRVYGKLRLGAILQLTVQNGGKI